MDDVEASVVVVVDEAARAAAFMLDALQRYNGVILIDICRQAM